MTKTETWTRAAGEAPTELVELRARLDRVDARILRLLARRGRLSLEAKRLKQRVDLPALDLRRESAVVAGAARGARELGLDPELVRDIYWRILELSRKAAP